MLLSIRHWSPRGREVGLMPAERIPEQPTLRGGLRFESDTWRDDRRYEAGWFADFRSQWRADLLKWREQFRARLEALTPNQEVNK